MAAGLIAVGLGTFGSLLSALPAEAAQSIPYKVNFQGRLTDNSGNIMPDGQYNIKFRIFDDPSAGSNVWQEDWVRGAADRRITVENGLFNIQFGTYTALSPSLFSGTFPLYLEVELPTPATATCSTNGCAVFTEGPMTPRQALASSAYAFNSDTLDGLDATAFAQLTAANTFTGANLFAPTTGIVALTVKASTAGGQNSLEVFDSSNVRQAYFDANGNFNVARTIQATSNNTIDLGTSGATFRSGYFGTSVQSPSFTGAGAVTLSSGGSGALSLDSASNILVIAANDTMLQRTAAGTFALDLNDSSATTFSVTNANGGATASLSVEGGITLGSFAAATSVPVCSNAGALSTCNSNPSAVTLQQAYAAGNTISTTSNDIAFTLNSSQAFTVATAAGATGATTFSLTDGSNATPPAQLVLVTNNDTNQPLAAGIKVTNGGGGITTAIDASGGNITNALAIGDNKILGAAGVIDFTSFDVSNTGAVTAVGVSSGAGLLQSQLGLTTSGAATNINAGSGADFNFATNINTGTSTGAVSIGNSAAGTIVLQSGGAINLTAAAASAISTGATSLTVTSAKFNLNADGDQTSAFTQLNGTSTTVGSGSGSTSMTLSSATNFDIGNYIQLIHTGNCSTGGPTTCYAKITNKAGNILTISPALTWSSGRTVNEFHIPEIGGINTSQTLTNRYGRGYYIAGVATGNGTTYYNEDGITSTTDVFDLLSSSADAVATLRIGNDSTTSLTLGGTSSTVSVPGNLSVTGTLTGAGPASGNSGHLTRSVTTLSPTVPGDNLTTTGNISTTGSGAISSAGAISAPTATNTINGLIINGGALSGVTTIATSGAINTATISGGTLSGGSVSGGTLSATAVNGLNVSSAAVAVAASATDLAIDAGTSGQVTIGATSTGNVLLGGGSGANGCTVSNSNGNFVCSGTVNTATISGGTLSGGNISGGTLTASAVNGLNVSATAIAVVAAATSLTVDAGTSGTISFGATSTGDILLGGGSGSSGCTITNSNGNFACSGTINGATVSAGTLSGGNISGGTLTASAVNGLNVSNTAIAVVAAATGLTIDAGTSGTVSIGATSTGDILLGGGSGANGCTINNSNGNLTCTGALSVATSTNSINNLVINGGSLTNVGANITGAGAVTLASTTNALTLTSGSGTLVLGSGILQRTASSLTIDVASAGTSTLTISNSNGTNLANLAVTGRTGVSHTTGTNGQGYFVNNSASTPIAAFQGLDLGGNTYSFFATNKYYNGTAWVDSGLSRVGSSFQIQNDNFTFYSFDTGTTFTSRFTVASGGNVGVGTTGAPSALLSVGGTTGNFTVDGSGNLVTAGDGTFNGGDVTTSAATATLFNTSATTLNLGGAATALTLGATTGTTNVRNSLTIGVADATTTLLVLDSGTSDSGTTNGSTYYNSSLGKFRCYENGTWKDCISTIGVRSFIDTTADAVVDNNTTSYWDNAAENNNTRPNIVPTATTKEVFGILTVETQSTGTGDVEVTARIERSTSGAQACNTGTAVGGQPGTFASNTNARKTSTASFLDAPASVSTQYYNVCADTDTVLTTANITRLRMTLFEVDNSNADLAEVYPSNDDTIHDGELVSLDPSITSGVKRSSSAYDRSVVGVVSTSPALLIGGKGDEGVTGVPVALSGRVPVLVSDENGPIRTGDPLTSSSIPGMAMKATQAGYVIGRAMHDFTGTGQGLVMAFVGTHYYNPGQSFGGDVPASLAELAQTDPAFVDTLKRTKLDDQGNLLTTIGMAAKVAWVNTGGQVVAWVGDTGEAVFKAVTAGIGQFGRLVTGEVILDKQGETGGRAVIGSGQAEVFIKSPKVTADSLISVTAASRTGGLNLYVKEKRPGEGFVVALERSGVASTALDPLATQSIQLDWLVVGQQ